MDSACSRSSGEEDGDRERQEAFQKRVHASLLALKKGEKRIIPDDDDDDDEALFDTVLTTYKMHCSQSRAETFSAPKVKPTEKKKKAEMFGVSF